MTIRSLALVTGLTLLTISTSAAATPRQHPVGSAKHIGGWFAPNAESKHPWLYVGSDRNSVITAYDLGIVGAPLVRKITDGINSPGGIAVDANGTLYVPNQHGGNVTVYLPTSNEPATTLTGVNEPQSVAVDAAGDVFVCNRGNQPGIYVFPAGQTQPSEHITSSLIQVPNQIEFDGTGTLYISDDNTGISILPPGPSQTVISLGLQGLHAQTSGMAIDPADGSLFVSNAVETPYYIQRYAAGQQHPEAQLELGFGGLDFLAVGTIHGHKHVFVPDSQGDFIYVLKPGLSGNPGVITTASGYVAVGVAFKPAGVL